MLLKSYVNLIRPLSNIKNLALIGLVIFIGSIPVNIWLILKVFLALSFVCSSFYVYNSLADIDNDKNNENKKHYHSAVTAVGAGKAKLIYLLLLILGLFLGFTINLPCFAGLAALWLATFFYSDPRFCFKKKPVLDVVFGAWLTFGLRYLIIWWALAPELSVSILGLVAVMSVKAGGYLLYKELDRAGLVKIGIKNTITLNTVLGNVLLASFFLVLAFSCAFALLPKQFWPSLCLAVPPLALVYAKIYQKIKLSQNILRTLGFIYMFFCVLIIWLCRG